MSLTPKVALSQDFLAQLAKLPPGAHARIMKWATKFQVDPTSPGLNYEKINGARDPNLRSVRVDSNWRCIVFKPAQGNVYVLLYIGPHDDAYHWAENRKLAVNPITGAMQLIVFETAQAAADVATAADVGLGPDVPGTSMPADDTTPATPAALFASLSDHELVSLGTPPDLLPRVRALHSEVELDALQTSLPVEAYEGLFLALAGDTVSQILTSRETRVDRTVDVTDYAASLETPEAQSRFVVMTDDETLRTVMNAPLTQWRVFLHPTQGKLATGDRSGPTRVLGQAGTGKTVLAMHRAKWLAENRTPEPQKVLFTTFTRNLAADIQQNLRTLCSPETLDKMEITNLDAWVAAFMRSRKLEHRIVYDRREGAAKEAWELALAVADATLALPEGFYEDELEQVVLAQGITSLADYHTARRTGRKVVLARRKRDAVWPVFEEYRGQLASRKLKEVNDAYREVAELLSMESQGDAAAGPYSAIVVDETQDLSPQALRLLRALIPTGLNDLFFVGDGHQRIYSRNRAIMSQCGIQIRGRAHKLYLNYRTTEEIRQQAVALLEGCEVDDLDGGRDDSSRYKSLSHGPTPRLADCTDLVETVQIVLDFIHECGAGQQGPTSPSLCVITGSNKLRDAVGLKLANAGLHCVTINANDNHAQAQGFIHLATMHRAKGLEFDCVAVIASATVHDDPDRADNQRKLLYVALTRARRAALLVRLG